jgi:hypothetical protein
MTYTFESGSATIARLGFAGASSSSTFAAADGHVLIDDLTIVGTPIGGGDEGGEDQGEAVYTDDFEAGIDGWSGGGDGTVELGDVRQRLEPLKRLRRDRLAVTLDRIAGQIDKGGGIKPPRNRVVMIAGKRDFCRTANERYRLRRQRAVPDHISETDRLFNAVGGSIGQHPAQG